MIVDRWSGVFIDPGSGKSFRAASYGMNSRSSSWPV